MTLGPLGNTTPSHFTTAISPTCTVSPTQSGNKSAPRGVLLVPIFNAHANLVGPHAHGGKLRRRIVLRAGHP